MDYFSVISTKLIVKEEDIKEVCHRQLENV